MCQGRAVGVLERIRELIGKGGVSIPTLEDAAVGAPRGGHGPGDDRRPPAPASDGIVIKGVTSFKTV
jgi:hypothetical protein